jgi:hypothetical protein
MLEVLKSRKLLAHVTPPALNDFLLWIPEYSSVKFLLIRDRPAESSVGPSAPKFKKDFTHVDTQKGNAGRSC